LKIKRIDEPFAKQRSATLENACLRACLCRARQTGNAQAGLGGFLQQSAIKNQKSASFWLLASSSWLLAPDF
jgi:hypothetical protein